MESDARPTMTFRRRILLAMAPLYVLLLALGVSAVVLIYHLGNRLDYLLSDNYQSVISMRNVSRAMEHIDTALRFSEADPPDELKKQLQDRWQNIDKNLEIEHRYATLPGEAERADRAQRLIDDYRRQTAGYLELPLAERHRRWAGEGNAKGLHAAFLDVRTACWDVINLNNDNLEQSRTETHQLARGALLWYAVGLMGGLGLAFLLARTAIRTIVAPVRAVIASASAIGEGNLDQVLPVTSGDELGQLAQTFNVMVRQLRAYRQSQSARLVRAQQTSQATIDSFHAPVLVTDTEGRVEMANPAARRLLDLPPHEEHDGHGTVWTLPEPLQHPLQDVLRTRQAYLPEGFDKAFTLPSDAQSPWYLPRILPIRDPSGAAQGAAVLLEDVTRFRLLDEVKTNLVATVSHELKTPLTGIRLVLHLLLEERAGPLAPRQAELLSDARDNAERLLAMINSLLDLARLEQGRQRLGFSPQSPAALLKGLAELYRLRAGDRGIELHCRVAGDLPAVFADPEQIERALQNLLDNALAHTPHGGRVELAADATRDAVEFSVTDNGCGIAPEFLSRVFDKYFRVPGDTVTGGSGLGLAIVREIAAAHGGSVACESRPGQRTVFRMAIPQAAPEDAVP